MQERLGDRACSPPRSARSRAPTSAAARGREAGTRRFGAAPCRRAPAGCPRSSSASKREARKLNGRERSRRDPGSRGRRRPAARASASGWNELGSKLGSASGALRAGRSRRTRVEASRIAWPERRRSAPSEAPVRKSTPTSVSSTPRIVEPVVPTPSRDERFELPADPAAVRRAEREHQPDAARRRAPSRNGPTSTSALRVTISAPSGSSATGET